MLTDENFFSIVQDTWTSTLGFQVEPAAFQEVSTHETLNVRVKMSGAWDGEVLLSCPPELAAIIASAIFRVEAESVDNYEMLDALSEIIHIIGGNLKALLPQPVTLSLPLLPGSASEAQSSPQRQVVTRLTLMSKGHPFIVALLGGIITAKAGQESRPPAS